MDNSSVAADYLDLPVSKETSVRTFSGINVQAREWKMAAPSKFEWKVVDTGGSKTASFDQGSHSYELHRASSTPTRRAPSGDQLEKAKIFKQGFKTRVEMDNFEFGITSAAELFIEEQLSKKPIFTKNCLNELYIENVGDEKLTLAILKVLAHSDRRSMYPVADTIAIAALSHSSLEVRECGVRAFEYWESEEALSVLEHTALSPEWLEEYKLEVIANIRGRNDILRAKA